MTSYLPERRNTSDAIDQSMHGLHSGAVAPAQTSQQPIPEKYFSQPGAEGEVKSIDEAVCLANHIADLRELWKLSAYKQLEGWRRSGP
jgi:hypothetical protein